MRKCFILGGGLNVKAPGTNLTFGLGLNFSGEYRFTEHYSGRLNLKYIITSFHDNKYFGDETYTQGSYEADFLYHPFNGSTQLYGGVGIGYFVPNSRNTGHLHRIPGNLHVNANHINNSPGYNLLGGIKFGGDSPFFITLELKYTFLYPKWTAEIADDYTPYREIIEDNLNICTLLSSLSFNFRI